jgi:hemolysin activation/secretion protein
LRFGTGHAGLTRTDLRGYIGLGSPVLALRARFALSDAPLPLSEQFLLGGGDTLRGYSAGHRAGDNLAAFSVEARVPVNSPLSIGRLGVKAFVDTGTVWSAGNRLRNTRFERGIGGGIYFGAGPLILDLDVGWPESGSPKVSFGLGVSF